MRWKLVALMFLISFSALQSVGAESLAIKASTPVEVSIYPVTSVSRGQASTFKVRAVSSIPVENFTIKILPSAGSRVLSGNLEWHGAMVPEVAKELTITLQLDSNSVPSVSVNSSIQMEGEARFAASATYRQQSKPPAGYQSVSKERKVPRKGRQVNEYQLN